MLERILVAIGVIFLKDILGVLVKTIGSWIAQLWRGKEQKKATEVLQKDIENKTPRTEERIKHEDDFINS